MGNLGVIDRYTREMRDAADGSGIDGHIRPPQASIVRHWRPTSVTPIADPAFAPQPSVIAKVAQTVP
jgi:hypothetical protein